MLRLKECRETAGMTQQEIAEKLKITRAAYTNIENGKRDPDTNTLNFLATLFDVSTDYLLGRIDTPYPTKNMGVALSFPPGYDELNEDEQAEINQIVAIYTQRKYKKANAAPAGKEIYNIGEAAAYGGETIGTKQSKEEFEKAQKTARKLARPKGAEEE